MQNTLEHKENLSTSNGNAEKLVLQDATEPNVGHAVAPSSTCKLKSTTIGGQALLEGILMKGPFETSVVTRGVDGKLEMKVEKNDGVMQKYPIFRLPFFRGVGALWDSMGRGMKALEYATDKLEESEEREKLSKADTDKVQAVAVTDEVVDSETPTVEEDAPGFFERHLGKEKAEKLEMFLLTGITLVIGVGLFFFVPTWIANFFRSQISSNLILNLIEGFIRILFFLAYVVAISQLEELRRVFMYHGAEHKTIACYEHGEPLTIQNVRKYPRVHPRCGTSFLANMVILSALVLSLFGWPNPIVRLITRILLIPVLVGITYELNLWTGRHDNLLSKALRIPGKFIQQVATVKEPDDGMIEAAIMALEAVIPEDPEADVWK